MEMARVASLNYNIWCVKHFYTQGIDVPVNGGYEDRRVTVVHAIL